MQIAMTRLILYVRDVARLKLFYQTHFGFRVIEEIGDEWAVLLAGQVELALHLVGKPWRSTPLASVQSNAKLVFTVDSGLAELRTKLGKADVPVGEIKSYPGFAFFLCDGRDPEGNVFQLSEPDLKLSYKVKHGDKSLRTGDMQHLGAVFAKIKTRFDERNNGELICKQGSYKACSVLKLQKAYWTNDPMDRVQNKSGVFFSIWMNDVSTRKNRANYNIHALKLRQLEGYSITSRDFANDFRKSFASMRDAWPNVSVDYGPLTLMQGWIEVDPKSFEKDILVLLERFKHVCPMIDSLLKSRCGVQVNNLA